MSSKFAILPEQAIFDNSLSAIHLRILSVLCYYGARKDDGCWPSHSTIAERLAIARATVSRACIHLEKRGFITKEVRRRDDGSRTTNVYRVKFDLECIITEDQCNSGVTGDATAESGGVCNSGVTARTKQSSEQDNRTNKNIKKGLKVSLEEWEKKTGSHLCVQQMEKWVDENQFDHSLVKKLIIEFRGRMLASGTQYVNFVAAFQDWLRRGFLTMKISQLRAAGTGQGRHEDHSKAGVRL